MYVKRLLQRERATFLKGKNQDLSSLPFLSEFLFFTVVLKVTVKLICEDDCRQWYDTCRALSS